jgi:tetratricopeptide (TPR) repeat protein
VAIKVGMFGRKKGEQGAGDGSTPPPGSGNGSPQPRHSPDKAALFFDRARTAQETANYEYAMTLWLQGLRQDPTSMRGLEAFFQSCASFLNDGGKLGKDTRKMFDGREPIERYLSSLLEWGMEPLDAHAAIRAAEHASKLGLLEPTNWIGERALGAIAREKKPSKNHFKKMVEIFMKVGIAEKAVEAAGAALQIDPSDGALAAEIRNLSAQATMAKGGYEQTGQAGGFRQNIRDLDKQRRLDDADRIVKTEETLDRLVTDAEADYQKRPNDPAAIGLLAKRLIERGRPEDEKRAIAVLRQGYTTTKEFRFSEQEGTLKLRIAHRKLTQYKDAAESTPASAKAQENYRQAQAQYAQMELDEFKRRVENYPTDLGLKFELGKRYFAHGDTEKSIELFQLSQEDARHRVESLKYLGQSFQRIGWTDEAVHTFRQAIETHKIPTDDTGMELRYGLLTALQAKAEADRDLSTAEEADKLASGIAVQQISYKDVRARRDTIKKLIADLKRGDN